MYGMAFLALKQGDLTGGAELAGQGPGLDRSRGPACSRPSAPARTAAPLFTALDLEIKLAPGQPPRRRAQARGRKRRRRTDKFPLSRMLARQYADAMIADGQLEEAAQYLRDQVQQYREEPKLYDQLAKTYAAQGKIALQHMALAESYVLSGALPAAVDQLAWRARRRTCPSTTSP